MNELFNAESIYNTDYIKKHKLSDRKIKAAGIELLGIDEIFVQYPLWNDYYGSNYGRLISVKYGVKLLTPYPTGKNEESRYLGYRLFKKTHGTEKDLSISCHRLVADIFLPNYWKHLDRTKLQAHHLDGSKKNNYYKNIVLLPINLHKPLIHKIKKMILLDVSGKFKTVTPYQIIEETGLTMEDILEVIKGKPIKSQGKYSIFDVKGYEIGYQFYPKKSKKK